MKPIELGQWAREYEAVCDRLVDPSPDESARGFQRRLFGVIMAAPFILSVLIVPLGAWLNHDPALLLGALCMVFAGAFALLGAARMGVASGLVSLVALAATGSVIAFAMSATGGFFGPLAVLLAAPVFEAWWVRRSRAAIATGCAAAVSIALWQMSAGAQAPVAGSGAVWALAGLFGWLATVWIRLSSLGLERAEDEGPGEIETKLDAVVLRLGQNGDVLEANGKALDILDLPPSLVLGTGLFERIHVGDRVAYLTAIADLRDGARARVVELRLRLPDSDRLQAQFQHFVLDLCNTGSGIYMGFLRDDARVAVLHAEVQTMKETADGAEIAKSRFLAAVSHELRTPLNAIIGFADMVDQEMFGALANARQKEYIGLISKSGHHLLSVVNAILDVSKIESGTYSINAEPFDFAEATAMPLSIARQQADIKSINLNTSVIGEVTEVVADRRAIQQILINLLSNAVKFTPDGGKVVLGARQDGGRFIFWVEDDGIGISAEDLGRLGRPFMQVQNDYTRSYEGTGLGLSLVKGLAALHDGTAEIESAPGEGTRVTVSIPCREIPALDGAKSEFTELDLNGADDGKFQKTA